MLNAGYRLSVSIAQFPVPVFVKGSAAADWLFLFLPTFFPPSPCFQFPVPVFVKGSATADWLDGSNAFMSRMVSDYVARFRLRPLL